MSNYKELSAFESVDEFKVGDMVQIYANLRIGHERIIKEIDDNIVLLIYYYKGEEKKDGWFHYKQCRKLVEVKLSEYWINPPRKLIDDYDGTMGYGGDWIHVREVIDANNE